MHLRVEVNGQWWDVAIRDHEGGRWRVAVGSRELVLDVADGHALVTAGEGDASAASVRYEVLRDVQREPEAARLWGAGLEGEEIPVRVEGLRRPRAGRSASRTASGRVTAPMNGQVIKVLRAPGDALDKGDVVLVLEAMKMENEVTTPVAGVLKRLDVQPGVTVKPGAPLFEVAPEEV